MRAQAKKWVVTGGAGFIGSHIIKELVARGQQAVAVDDFSTGSLSNLSSVQQKIKIVSADICDFSALLKAFQGADYVLHHAALVSVPRSVEEPQLTWQINVSGTLNVLEAARQAGIKRVVFASSCCVCMVLRLNRARKPRPSVPVRPMRFPNKSAKSYAAFIRKCMG